MLQIAEPSTAGFSETKVFREAFTVGLDEDLLDSLLIKTSASTINLSEEEAMGLVDEVRRELPMNK